MTTAVSVRTTTASRVHVRRRVLVFAVVGLAALLVPGCLLAGPLLLLTADVLGRLVVRPSELEVGIVTAFLGAPLLALLARKAAR
ncbi:hypothetical protein Scel_23230 [Streptomyces cellostaticus]|uniref:iron chelate uptake ABC transporter family permease subunit n=1 Tax=Streptomyces cellostaticus TaxID=67285 RepID=UPI0025CB3A22|nr:hypothetical protein Scel_23220 [Streptomyces cellostaticus]GHI04002.1 hypothetical protein Scel_23230 [Streptomyces cellostaticus]